MATALTTTQTPAMPDPPPRPLDEVLFQVASATRERGLLVVVGQYAPNPRRAVRVLVITRDGAPRSVLDAWMRPEDLGPLATALGRPPEVRAGASDAMYATRWKLAWTTDAKTVENAPPFELWTPRGLVAHVSRDGAFLDTIEGPLPRARIKRIEGYLSKGWVERGVRVVLEGRSSHLLARQLEPMAAVDPTYDGLDLMCDASWVRSLAESLAGALDVAVDVADGL